MTGSTVILTKYTQLLNAVGDEIQTNLLEKDISALVKMQLNDIGGWKIKSISIEGTGTSAETYSMGSRKLYVSVPNEESVKSAKNKINSVMYKKEQ